MTSHINGYCLEMEQSLVYALETVEKNLNRRPVESVFMAKVLLCGYLPESESLYVMFDK